MFSFLRDGERKIDRWERGGERERERERGWDSLRLCFRSRNLISTSCYKVVFLTVVFLLCLCIFFSSHSYQIVQYSKYYQNNIKSGHTQFQIKTKITSDIKILITLKGRGMLFPTYFFSCPACQIWRQQVSITFVHMWVHLDTKM